MYNCLLPPAKIDAFVGPSTCFQGDRNKGVTLSEGRVNTWLGVCLRCPLSHHKKKFSIAVLK